MVQSAPTKSDAPSPGSAAFPAVTTTAVVLGAACWALSIVFFVDQAIAQGASARPFSPATNLISDLGNTASTGRTVRRDGP